MASTGFRYAARTSRRAASFALAGVALGAALLVLQPATSAVGDVAAAHAQQVVSSTALGLPVGLLIWFAVGALLVAGVAVKSHLRRRAARALGADPAISEPVAVLAGGGSPAESEADLLALVPVRTAVVKVGSDAADESSLAHCA